MSSPVAQLAQIAGLYGIADSYLDYRNQSRQVALESQAAILAAFGVDAADSQAVADAIHQHHTMHWTRVVPPIVVARSETDVVVPVSIPLDLHARSIEWMLTLESGEARAGRAVLDELETIEEGSAEQHRYRRVAAKLPRLPTGYHRAVVTLDTGLGGELDVVVAPQHCYEAPPLADGPIAHGKRVWGIAVQLYSLRSPDNWGMGDLRDLRHLIRLAAPLGCGIVGLNPLHALLPADPAHISPYSPSNRQFLNVLYIALQDVPDLEQCELARRRILDGDFQAALRRARACPNVDYAQVAALKFEILKLLHESFRDLHLQRNSERAKAFRRFVQTRGEPLRLHAIYDALDSHMRLQGPQYWGWPSWPQEYRDPASAAVNRFAQERAQDIEYFLYLQWLVTAQLQAAQDAARDAGMSIGLYGDVAVGANPAGSETWSNHHLYRQGASIGAPPDELALKGQDWGIPPQDPRELRNQRYRPFVGLVRNNMRHVAALRFDHVMTLYRLWWVPGGMSSRDGAYVHYPLEDLIAILALESQRNRCVVIGEDLGTVPRAVTEAMQRYRAYHYKVLLFERTPGGEFKMPGDYERNALAVVTTHDLPTLCGWWEEHDLRLRDSLDLYPGEDAKTHAHASRAAERRALLRALVAADLWSWQEDQPLPPYSAAFSRATHAFLGLSNANVALIQIEDLIGMIDPVNVPGTHTEHANWQRKIALDTQEIFLRDDVLDIIGAMAAARSGRHPNHP